MNTIIISFLISALIYRQIKWQLFVLAIVLIVGIEILFFIINICKKEVKEDDDYEDL